MLDLYTDYLICSTSQTTATGLARVTDHAISHDAVTRFLSDRDYTSSDLWHVAKPLVKSMEATMREDDFGILAIDDTIEEKPYTDENEIVAYHYDHAKGTTVKGIGLLSAIYQTPNKARAVVAYDLISKTEPTINKKTKKISRKSSVSKQERYRKLIMTSIKNGVNFKYVTNDVWFSSAENMMFIRHNAHKEFVMPLKDNRKVALSEEKLAAGEFVSIKKLELGEGILVRLEGVDFPLRLVRQVFKNEDGSTGVLHLVSSDIELTDAQIIAIYQRRWSVEEYHKSLKCNASLAKSPTKKPRTQANHLFASLCAFIRLETISLAANVNHFALKDKIYIEALKMAFRELHRLKNSVFLQTGNQATAPA